MLATVGELLEAAVAEWAAANPQDVEALSAAYQTSRNTFLHLAEEAYFEAARTGAAGAEILREPIKAAAQRWLEAHPHQPDEYTSSGNRFVWAAETAYFERFPIGAPLANGETSTRHRGPAKKSAIPAKVRWSVWERDDFTCKHCGVRRFLSIDHIVPESLGGTLDMENLQTLCTPCNSRKGTRSGRRD